MQKIFFTKKVNKIKVFKKHRKQINYLLGNYKHSTLKSQIFFFQKCNFYRFRFSSYGCGKHIKRKDCYTRV